MRLNDWRQERIAGLEALLDTINSTRSSLEEADILQKSLRKELESYDPYYRACESDKDTLLTQQRLIVSRMEELQHQLESFVAMIEQTITAQVDSQLRLSSSGPIKDGLRVAYLNVDGARKKTAQIHYILQRYDLDVLFIGEAKLTGDFKVRSEQNKTVYQHWCQSIPDERLQMAGYSLEREDRKLAEVGQGGGGIIAYISNRLSYSVIERYTAVGNHPLQYIYIFIEYENVHLVGAYNPPSYKEDEHLRLLQRFKNQENLIIMGDMNIDYFSNGYPLPEIEADMGYTQLIKNYTRVSLQDRNSSEPFIKETLIDHIYTKKSQILESGVVRCGISDHDLIYCTLDSINPDADRRCGKDILQHDVPIVVSALIDGDNCCLDQSLLVLDPKFWLLSRCMETRRLTLCELIENCDIEGMKNFMKTSDFTSVINKIILAHDSCQQCRNLKKAIRSAKSKDIVRSECCLSKELGEWLAELGGTSNVFLSRMQIFFRFCFPSISSEYGFGLRVCNPHSLWSKYRTLNTSEKEHSTLVLCYKIANVWHLYEKESQFWESDLISDHGQVEWRWSDFIQTDMIDKTHAKGMIELDNLVGHQYLQYKLKDILSSCEGEMVFNSDITGAIYLPISLRPVSGSKRPATAQTPFRSLLPPPPTLPQTERTSRPPSRFGWTAASRLGYRSQHSRTQPVSTRPIFDMPQKLKRNIKEIITAVRQLGQEVETNLEWNVLGPVFKTQQSLPSIKEVLDKYPEVVQNPLIG